MPTSAAASISLFAAFCAERRDPRKLTVSSLKFPVTIDLFRPLKSCHVTLCCHYSAHNNISLYSAHSRHRRDTGRMGCLRQWARRRAQTHAISSTSSIILAVRGRVSAVPGNNAHKTARASIWEATLSHGIPSPRQERQLRTYRWGQVWEQEHVHDAPHSIGVFGLEGKRQNHESDGVGYYLVMKVNSFRCDTACRLHHRPGPLLFEGGDCVPNGWEVLLAGDLTNTEE